MNEWLRENLICPRDRQKLKSQENNLICPENHVYPVIDGIPVMLLDEIEPNHHYITETLDDVSKNQIQEKAEGDFSVENNAFVQHEVPHTSGGLYFPVQYKLNRYPIPELRLPLGNGERLLDVGCNWGRWTVAAAQKNYRPVGIDPSLKAVLAARKVSRHFGVETDFVVADARRLPFADSCFDTAFSSLVLQSFSKENARMSLKEIARVIKNGGKTLMQMPNKYGVRSIYQQARRGFREGEKFEVRYWSPAELKDFFESNFGSTKMTADCFLGLGVQKSDIDLLPAKYKAIVHSSEFLRRLSRKLPLLVKVADSVYLESVNEKNGKRKTDNGKS